MTSPFRLGLVGGAELEIEIQYAEPDSETRLTPPTRCTPDAFSVVFERGDGSLAGHGFPLTIWFWRVLTVREINLLLALLTVNGVQRKSRQVWLCTRTPEDHHLFGLYTAWLRLPDSLHEHRQTNGQYYDVSFQFSMLEPYVP